MAVASSRGFICTNAAVSAVGTSFALAKIVTMDGTGTLDANAAALPGSAYLSHIEFQGDVASGSPTTLTFYLMHDVLGDYPFSGQSAALSLVSGLTDATLKATAVGLDVAYQITDRSVPGKLYAMTKVDSGTLDLTEVRLYWTRTRGG